MIRMPATVVLSVCLFASLAVTRSSSQQADSKRKGMDLSFTYDKHGKLSKFSIKSNQIDETEKLPVLLSREQVSAVMEEVLPESERGVLLRQYEGISTRSGYGETTVYEKAQIDLSLSCCKGFCGVGYAEIRVRE